MTSIPDHDGFGLPGLGEAFERIDAERRLLFVPGGRRVFRAAAAMDHAASMELWRELGLSVADIAAEIGLTEWEVRRLIMEPTRRAAEDARFRFRFG